MVGFWLVFGWFLVGFWLGFLAKSIERWLVWFVFLIQPTTNQLRLQYYEPTKYIFR